MKFEVTSRKSRFEGLGFSQLLSFLFLAACVWSVYRYLEAIIGASKITGSISWTNSDNPVLMMQLAVFAFTVLLVHVALGFLIWVLARLTRAALPDSARHRLPALILAWTFLLVAFVLAANATWYPASRFASEKFWLLAPWRGVPLLIVLLVVIGTAVASITWLAFRRAKPFRHHWSYFIALGAVLVGAAGALALFGGGRSQASMASTSPHVVILGVDSLRNDLSEASQGRSLTPNIDAFVAGAHRFTDAISPLARTFPAWVSILTGRHPVSTNARFNLMPRALVHEGDTLGDALQARGYRSIFATDEVRFANFDESYGFDELITPPIGASDFVLGAIGDIPLVNIVAGTEIGRWVFPGIHANRAAAVTYDPQHFVARLERELQVNGPSLLAIHLTLSHWPYSWTGQPKPTTPQEFRPAYGRALEEVDRQFRDVLQVLERKGVLANAIVVVLSDHGEALGFKSDSMLRKTGTHREIWDSLWGHGTSVVSPHQYSVLLAMRAFGATRLPASPRTYDWPVSLEDVRPTLEELVTGHAPSSVDGIPLVAYLTEPARAELLKSRIRFTETCFNTIKMLDGKITESGVVSEAGIYYETVPNTGWVQLRPDRLHEPMARKQRAAISRDAILAAIPSWTDGAVTYLFSDRRRPLPRKLVGRPDPAHDAEAARLWDALQARFPGELPPEADSSLNVKAINGAPTALWEHSG